MNSANDLLDTALVAGDSAIGYGPMLEQVHLTEVSIRSFVDSGFDRIYLHHAGRNQAACVGDFGRFVLPRLVR